MVVCLPVCKIGDIFYHVHDLVRFTLALCFYASVQPKKGGGGVLFSGCLSVCVYVHVASRWRRSLTGLQAWENSWAALVQGPGQRRERMMLKALKPKGVGNENPFSTGGSYWTSLWTRERSKPYLSPCFNAKGQTKLKTFHRFTL